MWRHHGFQDEHQNKNINDVASFPSLLPESSQGYHKAKPGVAMTNDLMEREVALLCALQKMSEEMDRAWKDFFENNPDKKEENVWRRVEERLGSKQNAKNLGKGV